MHVFHLVSTLVIYYYYYQDVFYDYSNSVGSSETHTTFDSFIYFGYRKKHHLDLQTNVLNLLYHARRHAYGRASTHTHPKYVCFSSVNDRIAHNRIGILYCYIMSYTRLVRAHQVQSLHTPPSLLQMYYGVYVEILFYN